MNPIGAAGSNPAALEWRVSWPGGQRRQFRTGKKVVRESATDDVGSGGFHAGTNGADVAGLPVLPGLTRQLQKGSGINPGDGLVELDRSNRSLAGPLRPSVSTGPRDVHRVATRIRPSPAASRWGSLPMTLIDRRESDRATAARAAWLRSPATSFHTFGRLGRRPAGSSGDRPRLGWPVRFRNRRWNTREPSSP